ncbi:DUF4255 domain-containing protein [Streptomyces justiciae]|uniref:DUF4255 domain-containing protein n=1 Tax=Streptomyces justiciae TaxID=2780140 RepID=A0ABU3M0D1_9ACTN|nr:DUF4255 domain-containing protein [Streptomyces justiciae]MDT7844937.1 DUF4255 domain-containing protein [Streptomyces justiciae]
MIREVSELLVGVVNKARPAHPPWAELSSLSAADPDPTSSKLAVALYAVEEHPHLRNRPLVSSPEGHVRPPLALRLHYLMTFIGAHDEAQTRLSLVAAAFHTTPVIGGTDLPPALAGKVQSVTVRLTSPTDDERNQIWGALGRPGRLALYYEVDVAPVELLVKDGHGTVDTHRIDYVDAS